MKSKNFSQKFLPFVYGLKMPQRLMIAGLMMFLILYMIYSLIISVQLLELKSLRRQFMIQKDFIQTKKNKVRFLRLLEEEFNGLQRQVADNNQRFFSDEEEVEFLRDLNKLLEKETGNSLIFIRPSGKEKISESFLGKTKYLYRRSDVQVIATGEFNTLSEFFHNLYSSEKLLSLREINIEIEKRKPLLLKADFILSIYLLGQGKEGDIKEKAIDEG